jgi:P-type Ca2+ transporter type 2C
VLCCTLCHCCSLCFFSQDESKKLVEVRVQRSGNPVIVGTADVVVGDVVFLDTGAIIPADGILVHGSDLKARFRALALCAPVQLRSPAETVSNPSPCLLPAQVNESALTGESDDIAKSETAAPLLLSGAQVAGGNGAFVVTAVGARSMQGSIIQGATAEESDTPLQVRAGRTSPCHYRGICLLGCLTLRVERSLAPPHAFSCCTSVLRHPLFVCR